MFAVVVAMRVGVHERRYALEARNGMMVFPYDAPPAATLLAAGDEYAVRRQPSDPYEITTVIQKEIRNDFAERFVAVTPSVPRVRKRHAHGFAYDDPGGPPYRSTDKTFNEHLYRHRCGSKVPGTIS